MTHELIDIDFNIINNKIKLRAAETLFIIHSITFHLQNVIDANKFKLI